MARRTWYLLLAAPLLGLCASPARALDLDLVPIDDPGNPADDQFMFCCHESTGWPILLGSVDYVYQIGRTEITNAQYAEFLNAVAAAGDPEELWNSRMGNPLVVGEPPSITRTGTGPFSYTVGAGLEERPVAYIDFFDALRFANWLHNGQPTGVQDETTTEDGAYTLSGENPRDVARNEGALYWLPSEDEWYKAAFYDPEGGCYWDFATGTNSADAQGVMGCPDDALIPAVDVPPGDPGTVSANYGCCETGENCDPDCVMGTSGDIVDDMVCSAVCHSSDVGGYVHSPSAFGTFDQTGNYAEWTEGENPDVTPGPDGELFTRVIRGGFWARGLKDLQSGSRVPADPYGQQLSIVGFRVATVPEPGAGVIAALAAVLVLARRRRLRRAGIPVARSSPVGSGEPCTRAAPTANDG
jgi:formylglycine-generating enzyme required for sulfatase activity